MAEDGAGRLWRFLRRRLQAEREADRTLGYVAGYFLLLAALLMLGPIVSSVDAAVGRGAVVLVLPPLLMLAVCLDGVAAALRPTPDRTKPGALGLLVTMRGLPAVVILASLVPGTPAKVAGAGAGLGAGFLLARSAYRSWGPALRAARIRGDVVELLGGVAGGDKPRRPAAARPARPDPAELAAILEDAHAELLRSRLERPDLEKALDAAEKEATVLHAELGRLDEALAKARERRAAPERLAVLEREQARVVGLLASLRAMVVNLQADATWLSSLSHQSPALGSLQTEADLLHASAEGLSMALGEETST